MKHKARWRSHRRLPRFRPCSEPRLSLHKERFPELRLSTYKLWSRSSAQSVLRHAVPKLYYIFGQIPMPATTATKLSGTSSAVASISTVSKNNFISVGSK
jgi:hypothetical protein